MGAPNHLYRSDKLVDQTSVLSIPKWWEERRNAFLLW